ncbi:Uracil-DNA glycosylase, family 1 [Variovorax sp. WDL1]|nr:Uracil-DNA glycosylase, family 1 [Variovorax sp. WDL1]
MLTANHPSPLSALRPPIPFIGCGHFGEARAWRESQGL